VSLRHLNAALSSLLNAAFVGAKIVNPVLGVSALRVFTRSATLRRLTSVEKWTLVLIMSTIVRVHEAGRSV